MKVALKGTNGYSRTSHLLLTSPESDILRHQKLNNDLIIRTNVLGDIIWSDKCNNRFYYDSQINK